MAKRSRAEERGPARCGGAPEGRKATRSRRSASRAFSAARRCPRWIGSKVPPSRPIFIDPPPYPSPRRGRGPPPREQLRSFIDPPPCPASSQSLLEHGGRPCRPHEPQQRTLQLEEAVAPHRGDGRHLHPEAGGFRAQVRQRILALRPSREV